MKAIIFGCGRMGWIRAEALIDLGINISAVCDPDIERAAELARTVGAPRVLASEGESWPDADLAFVCTPPDSHGSIGSHAAARGLSLFVEKPLALSVENALPLAEAVRRAGVICAVGFMNRIRPSVLALHERLSSGAPFALTAHWMGSRYAVPWWGDFARSGGGFHEQGVHVVDLLTFLAGPVCEVSAAGYGEVAASDAPAVAIVFRFRSGGVASFAYSYLSPARLIEVVLLSSACLARLSGWSFDLHLPDETVVDGNGGDPDRNWIFRRETRWFIEGVRSGALPPGMADIESAVATQRVMDAIRESYATRRMVAVQGSDQLETGK
jgi:predicted dehydrogenase